MQSIPPAYHPPSCGCSPCLMRRKKTSSNNSDSNNHHKNCQCFPCFMNAKELYTSNPYTAEIADTYAPPQYHITHYSGRQTGKDFAEAMAKASQIPIVLPETSYPKIVATQRNPPSWTASPSNISQSVSVNTSTGGLYPGEMQGQWGEEESKTDKRMVGHVYGLRAFSYNYGKPYLRGLWDGKWYSPRQNAKCRPRGRTTITVNRYACKVSPGERCLCGINMYKISTKDIYPDFHTLSDRHPLVALMQGWGRVIEHDDGYRVQKALIVALYSKSERDLDFARSVFKGQKKEPIYISNRHEMLDWLELHKAQDDMNKENIYGGTRQTCAVPGCSGTHLHRYS